MKENISSRIDPGDIRWSHCACVLIGIVLATLVRFPIQPVIQDASPFVFYFPVVLAGAIFFGWRMGLLAIALSMVPADYFWMAPYRTFTMDTGQVVQIIGFSVVGFSVSWLSEAVRKRKQLAEHLCSAIANMGDAVVMTDCRGRILYLNIVARVLTELHGHEGIGSTFGGALYLFDESGAHSLNGAFQAALSSDDVESLPRRVILSNKSGKRNKVEQKASRVFNAKGEILGMTILFHLLECEEEVFAASALTSAPVMARATTGKEDALKGPPNLGAADMGGGQPPSDRSGQ